MLVFFYYLILSKIIYSININNEFKMKKLKILTLNKEVISILEGNTMNQLKGGTGNSAAIHCTVYGLTCPLCPTVNEISCDTVCFICKTPTPTPSPPTGNEYTCDLEMNDCREGTNTYEYTCNTGTAPAC